MMIVDVMASDVWSEADIVRRTEALIRAEFSREEEAILNRKVTGATLGQYTLTTAEQAQLARFAAVSAAARQAGDAARADMARLLAALAVEAAQRRLALPATEDDVLEREAAQAVIDAASAEVLELVALRNAVPDGGEA